MLAAGSCSRLVLLPVCVWVMLRLSSCYVVAEPLHEALSAVLCAWYVPVYRACPSCVDFCV